MEFRDVVEARRSVRNFTSEKVPDDVIHRAIDAALLAPNSSNMQPWEFYWVRSSEKRRLLVEACFSQPAAATAQEIIVAVARHDTWRRNQKLMLEKLAELPNVPKGVWDYYRRLVPLSYKQGPFGIWAYIKWPLFFVAGFFRPVPRGPFGLSALFEVLVKTTALACENLMLSIVDQGYGCCPMEGFDLCRVKKILNLNRHCHVVMCIGIGRTAPGGIKGERVRFPKDLFVFEV